LQHPLRQQYELTKQAFLEYFAISRQAHHQQVQKVWRRAGEEAVILELVRAIRYHHPRMGTRKVWVKLQPQLASRGYRIGRDRLFDLLRRHDLLVPIKRRRTRTTRSGLWRCPNLLPELTISQPYQLWVGDITYLTLETGFAYLALLTDAFSRFIVGFDLSISLAVEGCHRALSCALRQAPCSLAGLVHHSDHGVQYTAHTYRNLLTDHRVVSSMGEVGNCYENALAERMNGILKLEYGLDRLFVDLTQAIESTEQAIYLYNYDRPHLALDYRVPAEVHFA
jgi:transposase InsO family protein